MSAATARRRASLAAMRRGLSLLVLVVATAGCRTPPAAPETPRQYRAWCANEGKFLTDWDPDRSHAEQARKRHRATWPHHQVTIRTR